MKSFFLDAKMNREVFSTRRENLSCNVFDPNEMFKHIQKWIQIEARNFVISLLVVKTSPSKNPLST